MDCHALMFDEDVGERAPLTDDDRKELLRRYEAGRSAYYQTLGLKYAENDPGLFGLDWPTSPS